jgi:soluble lytic murein transglycosylase-like protein
VVVQVAAAAVARVGAVGARAAGQAAVRGGAAVARGAARSGARAGGRATGTAARTGARSGARAGAGATRTGARTVARTRPGGGSRPGGATRPRNLGERAARRALDKSTSRRDRGGGGGRGGPVAPVRSRPPDDPEAAQNQLVADPSRGLAVAAGAAVLGVRMLRHPFRSLRRAGWRSLRRKAAGKAGAEQQTRSRRRRVIALLAVIGIVFGVGSTAPLAFIGRPSLNGDGTGGGFGTIPNGAGIPYAELFNATAELGVDPRFVAAVAWQESIHFDEDVIHCRLDSPVGAQGIMQFMPSTAEGRGVDPCDPESAIPGGARYLKDNHDRFGSWELALAAYNAGAGAVQQFDGIPPYRETQNYVRKIMAQYEVYKARFPDADVSGRGSLDGDYALPLDQHWYDDNPQWFTKPHHDYPAADIPVPTGTPVYAPANGTVHYWGGLCGEGLIVRAGDGVEFVYCHGSEMLVRDGAEVSAGDPIMRSGNTGNSTGPHLHVGINVDGTRVCPQPWLVAVAEGSEVPNPGDLPRSGCSY